MRWTFPFIVVFLALSSLAQAADGHLPGEVLVRVEEGTSPEQVRGIAQAVGAVVDRRVTSWDLYLLRFDEGETPMAEVVRRLEGRPGVVYAEPNYKVDLFTLLPGEEVAAASGGGAGAQVVVAVIDTGLDFSHPAFSGLLYANPGEVAGDGLDNDGNGYADDVSG